MVKTKPMFLFVWLLSRLSSDTWWGQDVKPPVSFLDIQGRFELKRENKRHFPVWLKMK